MTDLWLLVKYITLGLIQGFTEPIPISSSGHLVIFRELFGITIEGLSFEIIVNFGSLIAVLIIYRKDILRLTKSGLTYPFTRDKTVQADFHFILCLIVATIPTGLIGLFARDFIENKLAGVTIVGITLFFTGIALWIIRNLRGTKSDKDLTFRDALIVGLVQTMALIPGMSRSGATIVAAMLLGMKQETALRFSFLLYIPVSVGVTVFSFTDLIKDIQYSTSAIPYTLSFLAALIASYYALRWFMNIMRHGNLKYFAYYCFGAGLLVILFL